VAANAAQRRGLVRAADDHDGLARANREMGGEHGLADHRIGAGPRKDRALVRPLAFSPVSPSASTPGTTAVVIHVIRGRGAMLQPTRAHGPRVVGSAEP
jgi:hypothetical protein